MYIEDIEEYPYTGQFIEVRIDTSLPLNEQKEESVVVLETECDIQEASKNESKGMMKASYNVYFPLERLKECTLRKGMYFRGSMYGITVNGKIIGLYPTQLGVVVYLTDTDI